MDPRIFYQNSDVRHLPYTNCKTRIINLDNLDLPESATEDEYKRLFQKVSQEKTEEARSLTDAVNSVRYGIAPPVAFPTETVYGLGADATNKASIAGIFAAKGRPNDNPLIVHVASKDHLERLTGERIPDIYESLVQEFWPGPLTILVPVPQASVFAENVHPGQKTIGVRVPKSKYARFFISATDRPIAAPSANSSGKPSPTTAQHVFDDLEGKINFILDGGSCDVGVESTVVDGLCDPPLILRPGGISQDELIAHGKRHANCWAHTAIGYKESHSSQHNGDSGIEANDSTEAPRAPGMKYKHYAPQGKLTLFENDRDGKLLQSQIDDLIDQTTSKEHPNNNETVNGDTEEHTAGRTLRIAILTTNQWPDLANLSPSSESISQPMPHASNHYHHNGNTPTTSTISPPSSNPNTEPEHPQPPPPPPPPPATIVRTTTNANEIQFSNQIYRDTPIHQIHLGKTPSQIAKSLFATLRKCDDLGCTHILAEAPLPPQQQPRNGDEVLRGEKKEKGTEQGMRMDDHAYDAVLERMRKAASLIL